MSGSHFRFQLGLELIYERDYTAEERNIIAVLTCSVFQQAVTTMYGMSKVRPLTQVSIEDVILTMRANVRTNNPSQELSGGRVPSSASAG